MRALFSPCLVLSVLATMVNGATTPPDLDAWRKVSLGVASAGDNQWYFHPDSSKNPRVMVKATGTGANVNRRYLTGGPPVWTTGAAINTPSLNKQGVIVPLVNGIYLIACHNNALRLNFYNAAGTATITETVDDAVPISSVGLSAAIDAADGALHIAYVGNSETASETLRYARRSANGTWTKSSRDLSTLSQYVRETVILPSSANSAKIYASLKYGTDMSLLRLSINNANIVTATGDGNIAVGTTIHEHIAGNRNGSADCVYYFARVGSTSSSVWELRQAGVENPVEKHEDIGVSLPTSIISRVGPDNKQRIVWLDGLGKEVHYLKPGASGFDVTHPVKDTNGTAEVRGLHFDSANKPYLLYRNSTSAGFIAYPDEDQDTNGNGRPDLLDVAFISNTAGVQVLDPAAASPGLPLSENKFKFRIPTVGSAISNGAGGLFSDSLKLTYNLETSTDAIIWTTLGAGSPVIFVQHSTAGTPPNEVKVYSGMYNETIPAAPSRRFFRIKVSRPTGAY